MSDGHLEELNVKTIPSIVELRPSFWRHPIRWWKMRHLLPDMERSEREAREAMGDERYEAFNRRMDEAILGDGYSGTIVHYGELVDPETRFRPES